jgi:hypothetical protein
MARRPSIDRRALFFRGSSRDSPHASAALGAHPGRIQQTGRGPATAGASAASNGNGSHGIDLDMFVAEPGPATTAPSD